MPDSETPDLTEWQGKRGRWVTVMGRKRFISVDEMKKPSKHGLNTQTPSMSPEKAKAFEEIYKVSYNNSAQDSTEKPHEQEGKDDQMTPEDQHKPQDDDGEKGIPIYVQTTHDELDEDKDRVGTDAKVGETVKYDLGRRSGKLIKIDGTYALILRSDGLYDTVQANTVYKESDYTFFGLWKDIPNGFRQDMLRKIHASADYANQRWEQLPRQLKEVLTKADGSDYFTHAYDQHHDPSSTDDFKGAKNDKDGGRGGINSQKDPKQEPNWQSAFENKSATNRNPNVPEGISHNIINPQDDKRRDGRLHYDNEEPNNTIRDKPEEEDETAEEAELGCGDNLQSARPAKEKVPFKEDGNENFSAKGDGVVTTGDTGYDNPVYGEDAGFPKKKPTLKSYGIEYGVTSLDDKR